MTMALDPLPARPGPRPGPRPGSGGAKGEFRLTGWHVLGILGVFFGVMVAVNVVFVTLALKTHSGETQYAYMRGLHFNEVLSGAQAQSAQGWTMRLELERPVGGTPVLTAVLNDREGAPVRGATISGVVGRPATQAHDIPLAFIETGPGLYTADATGVGPGAWRFSATASRDGSAPFTAETRLSLR
jgi:nitrogen fixation protein FixH